MELSAEALYRHSKGVLNGNAPFSDEQVGVNEDDTSSLIREGVTGGNLRGPHQIVADTLRGYYSGDRSPWEGIYQQYTQDPELVGEVARYFRAGGVDTSPERIVLGSGCTQLFAGVCAIALRGAEAPCFVTEIPFYHSFGLTPQYYGGTLEVVPTHKRHDHKLTPESLKTWLNGPIAKRRSLKGILLFNPTLMGELYTEDELEVLFDFVVRWAVQNERNVPWIVEDAVYRDIDLDAFTGHSSQYKSIAAAHTRVGTMDYSGSDHTIVLSSVSKAFCAPNIRVGFAAVPESLVSDLRAFVLAHQVEVPRDHQRAALVALRDTPRSYLIDNSAEYRRRITLVARLVEEMNYHMRRAVEPLLNSSDKLRAVFSEQGIVAEGTDRFKIRDEHQFVSLYHTPRKGNLVYLDFSGMSGLSTEALQLERPSPFLTALGVPFENSLHLVRELMDFQGASGEKQGVVLGPGWGVGFTTGVERFICKFQVAQFGQPKNRASRSASDFLPIDSTFRELFLRRIPKCLVEIFRRNAS